MNFTLFTYKSLNFAQRQLYFAPSHDSETVTFLNSGDNKKTLRLIDWLGQGTNSLIFFSLRKYEKNACSWITSCPLSHVNHQNQFALLPLHAENGNFKYCSMNLFVVLFFTYVWRTFEEKNCLSSCLDIWIWQRLACGRPSRPQHYLHDYRLALQDKKYN